MTKILEWICWKIYSWIKTNNEAVRFIGGHQKYIALNFFCLLMAQFLSSPPQINHTTCEFHSNKKCEWKLPFHVYALFFNILSVFWASHIHFCLQNSYGNAIHLKNMKCTCYKQNNNKTHSIDASHELCRTIPILSGFTLWIGL